MKKVVSLLAASMFIFGCSVSTPVYQLPGADTVNTLGVTQTRKSHIETLVDRRRMETTLGVLSGRSPLQDSSIIPERGSVEGRLKTRTYIVSRLEALGYKVERHSYRKNGENILTRLMATVPTDEYVLVGAHMDSVRNAGANDNGSGSTAVLEVATVLRQLETRKVNIIFAWFDEEELGLIGSEYLARDYKKQGLKITSVHTIDMMGWDADKDGAIEIERPDGVLWDYYKMVNDTHKLGIKLSRTNSGSTDHVAFRDEGFTSVGLCEEWAGGDTTPHYHKKSDTYENINFDILNSGTKLLAAVIGDLALKVAPPRNIKLVPHNKFPGRDRHFHSHY